MSNVRFVKRPLLLFCYIIIPNLVLECMSRINNYYYSAGDSQNKLWVVIFVIGLVFGIFVYGTIMTQSYLSKSSSLKDVYIVPVGYLLNITINFIPIICHIHVDIIMSFTYLLYVEWFSVMVGLTLATFLLAFKYVKILK